MAKDRTDYYANYHKENYVSNKSKITNKVNDRYAKELLTIAYHANMDGGDKFTVSKAEAKTINGYDKEYLESLIFEGWSDVTIFDNALIGSVVDTTKFTVGRDIAKFIELGYLLSLGKYHLDGYTFDSGAYMVNIPKIQEDFADDWFMMYKDLGNKYYQLIMNTKEKSKIILNNKCMQEKLWQTVSKLIDDYNECLEDDFRVHFLEENDGNYEYSRYYTNICRTKNPERHNGNTERYEELVRYFGVDAKFIDFDINAMMYRTTYNMINDIPLSMDADVYYELYKKMVSNPISQKDFKCSKLRTYIKENVMSIYMDPRSVYCKINNQAKKYSNELNVLKDDYVKSDIIELECLFGMSYADFLTTLKEALYLFLSVYDFNGDLRVFFGNMFFKYEACIYYYMRKCFKDLGIDTINVYDGFYFIENTCTKELFYEVYHKAIDLTKKLLEEYNHNIVDIYGKTFRITKIDLFSKKNISNTNFTKKCDYIEKYDKVDLSVATIDEDKQKEHIEKLKANGEKYEF